MNITPTNTVYSVTTLTRELKSLVEMKFRFIQVQGEISNLKKPFSGHAYFTLKDSTAQIKAVLFKGQARYLEKALEDGQKVVCHGRISIYEPRGDYQLIVDSVDFHGSGLLQQRFEKLKKQLQTEGLFAQENKRPLPEFPKEVVLLTSPSGAAVHDFLKIWRKRNFPTTIKVFPVRVQGSEAAAEIVKALDILNVTRPQTEIVVLLRGGGSLEDLWPFNEEILARAIAKSEIPVVSAIGHEVDFSISDFCSDLRAPTPTAAAEMIIPDGNALGNTLKRCKETLLRTVFEKIDTYQYKIDQNRRLLGDMDSIFTNASLRLDHTSLRLVALVEKLIHNYRIKSGELSARLNQNSPFARIQMQEQQLRFTSEKLIYQFENMLIDKESKLARQAALLDVVSPLATISRGYSITNKINPKTGRKTLVRKSSQLAVADTLEIRLHSGRVSCEVTGLTEEKKST